MHYIDPAQAAKPPMVTLMHWERARMSSVSLNGHVIVGPGLLAVPIS